MEGSLPLKNRHAEKSKRDRKLRQWQVKREQKTVGTGRQAVESVLRRNKILQGSSLTTFRKTSGKSRAALLLMVTRFRAKKHRRQPSVDSARMRNVDFQDSSLDPLMMSASYHVVRRLTTQLRRQPLRRQQRKFPTTADNVQTKRLELAGFSGQQQAWRI